MAFLIYILDTQNIVVLFVSRTAEQKIITILLNNEQRKRGEFLSKKNRIHPPVFERNKICLPPLQMHCIDEKVGQSNKEKCVTKS